jgi:hypothetical protein
MAVAVLIDATVVRGVLLPAGLALLGDRAWAMPGRPRFRGRTWRPEVESGSVRENLNVTLDENDDSGGSKRGGPRVAGQASQAGYRLGPWM